MNRQDRQRRKHLVYGTAVACLCTGYLWVQAATAEVGITTRVSVDSQGIQANGISEEPALSADGRFVAFESWASNLVPNDTNNTVDVFVHDRSTGHITRVNVDSQGIQAANAVSYSPALSADGRFVAFSSVASNLVPNDTNDTMDIFVHDRSTGHTTRVSVDSQGTQANDISWGPTLSADGRFVAFNSWASNLGPNDTNDTYDVFVHDRSTGHTTRVSVDSQGIQANNYSWESALSADGRFVAFASAASNLGPNDTNDSEDVFVHGRAFSLTALHSGKCLDVRQFSQANGATVQQWNCHGRDNQRWVLESVGTADAPSYLLRAVHSGKCLDVRQFSQANGATVQQWNCHGRDNQRWLLGDPLSF